MGLTVPFVATIYEFEDCAVDPSRFELRRGGVVEHVEPQVFDVLVHLIRHRDRVVTKAELLDTVWGDRFVSESALAEPAQVGAPCRRRRRRRPARDPHGVRPRLPVRRPGGRAPRAGSTGAAGRRCRRRPLQQTVRFCTASDGHRIAYATIGSGPVLVKAANWLTHLDHDRETSIWGHWLEGLATGRTLVRYDERGCGMSDWDVEHFRFEDWVDDLETVVDAVGLDCFPLLGVSQGAAVAVAFAAAHPERVSRLVLASAYARGRLARAVTEDERREAALDLEVARVGWGRDDPSFRQVFTSQFLPDGTREEWEEFNELQRHHDVAGERRSLPRDVRPDRCHRSRAEGQMPDAGPALPRRPPPAGGGSTRPGRTHPRLRVRPAAEPQPHPPRRTGVADLPRRAGPLPGLPRSEAARLTSELAAAACSGAHLLALGAADESPGRGAGRLAARADLRAGDERVLVAVGTLQQAPAAGRQVVGELRRVQAQGRRSR